MDYSRRLGEFGVSCSWAPTGDGGDQLIPCRAIITVASASKFANKQPLSTAVVNFWATADALGNSDLSSVVAPIAIRSTGSWPKPDNLKDFSSTIDDTTQQIYLTIDYWKAGWNPASTK